MSDRRRFLASVVWLTVSFALLYGWVAAQLVHDWTTDDNYSHGFVIIPLAGYLTWERRLALRRIPLAPRAWGLLIVAASIATLIAGLLGAEHFLPRIALIGTLAGGIVFVLGWEHLKAMAFPLGVLLLMIPIPAILFNQIVMPLQLIASRVGETSLVAAGIPVLREGNILILAGFSLEVAEACSGIRSLVSLLTLGIVCGYFVDRRSAVRTAIALSAIPVAILANGLRVAGAGFSAHFFGPAAARGFVHSLSGWFMFAFAFVLLAAVVQTILRLFPAAPPMRALPVPVA